MANLLNILLGILDIQDITERWLIKSNSSEKNMLFTRIFYQNKDIFLTNLKTFVEFNAKKITKKEDFLKVIQAEIDSLNTQTNAIFTEEAFSYFQEKLNFFPNKNTESLDLSNNDMINDEWENSFQLSNENNLSPNETSFSTEINENSSIDDLNFEFDDQDFIIQDLFDSTNQYI